MLVLMLNLFLGIQLVKAQNASKAMDQNVPVLTGSTLKSEDIAVKADSIFIGEIVQMSFPDATAPDLASYSTRVKVLQVLRGSANAQVTVSIDTYAMNHEEPPKVATPYIFFVRKEAKRFEALKLLPATEVNVAKVKALIAAAPAKK
jgi:hypothetical protein